MKTKNIAAMFAVSFGLMMCAQVTGTVANTQERTTSEGRSTPGVTQRSLPVSGEDIRAYLSSIQQAVRLSLGDLRQYKGMECTVRIHMARDGMIIDARPEGGEPAACDVFIRAIQRAHIPAAGSDELYEIFKNAPVDFKF